MRKIVGVALLVVIAALACHAAESNALAISQNIQAQHLPYGTILDPQFKSSDSTSPDYSVIVSYTRCRDSAIWTGHYLAAESFRYAVTGSADALANVQGALNGISNLRQVTGTDVLARCLFPVDSPYAADLAAENAGLGIYQGQLQGQSYEWVGNTSRDQYSGVIFGLGVAYDMVSDCPSAQSSDCAHVRNAVRQEVTRLLTNLLANNWAVVMPNGTISTVFWAHPE